jgi:hypothetical protein
MRRYEEKYRLHESDDVLSRENFIHQDLDLRLDSVEKLGQAFAEGNRGDIEALIAAYRDTVAGLAKQVVELLGSAQGGVSADAIAETADRLFLTAARRAAILADLRGGVDASADTLAKLYDLVLARVTAGDLSAAIAGVRGTADAAHDTLGELGALIDATAAAAAANATALAAKADATATATALSNRMRLDGDGGYSLAAQLQGRQNIGARGAGILAKSAAYSVATADAGKLIAATGTWPLALPPAATAGNGFAIEVSNTGTGKITITPNGTDRIGGLATLVVNRRESGTLVSDGANWQAVGFSPVIIAESLSATSYYRQWSTGRIEQGGSSVVTTASNGTAAVAYPLAFPNVSYLPVITNGDNSAGNPVYPLAIAASTLTGFTIFAPNNGNVNLRINWRSDGY